MFNNSIKDSYLLGIIIGIISVLISYFTLIYYEHIMEGTGTLRMRLYPPKLQLIILGLTIILFRFMVVKWQVIKTAKGLFITVFIATLIYFFNERYKFL